MAFGDVCYGGKADIACFSCTPVSADKPWRRAGQLRQLFGSLSKVQRLRHEWLTTKPGLDAILSYSINGDELFSRAPKLTTNEMIE